MNKFYSSGLIEFFNLANQTVEPPTSIVEVGYEVGCLPILHSSLDRVDLGDKIAGIPKIQLVTNKTNLINNN